LPLYVSLALGAVVDLGYARGQVAEPLLIGGWLLAQCLWLAAFLPALPRPRRPARAALVEGGAVLVVLGVAAGLRLWGVGDLPQRIHGDVTTYGLEGRAILAGQYQDFFGVRWAGIPLIGYLPTAFSLWLF